MVACSCAVGFNFGVVYKFNSEKIKLKIKKYIESLILVVKAEKV